MIENNTTKIKNKRPFYIQTWFICLCFLLWIFIVPALAGIVLLILHYLDEKNRNIKYGKYDELEQKIQSFNTQINDLDSKRNDKEKEFEYKTNQLIRNFENKTNELENQFKEKEKQYLEMQKKLQIDKEELENELNLLHKDLIVESVNIDDYSDIPSEEIKNKLQLLKLEQDAIVKKDKAVTVTKAITNDNKKYINSNIKQILRSFNSECKGILDNISIKNIDTSRGKIQRSFETLNSIFKNDSVQISKEYYESKLKELTLIFAYIKQLENEKEQQKAIREQLIEEEKVRREIEREKQKIDKEESQFKNEITKLMGYLNKTNADVEKQLYVDKIRELEDKLKLLEKDKENVLQREQNTRAGYVYIISNIGSFGENVYKIGMTRRLEPMDRIKELSDASVPFQFDVHALIFSEDAPKLENILHNTFKDGQVNKVNPRKEFYNIDLDKIKEVVKENYNSTVDFTDYAEAYEYRESLKIAEKLKN